jgi:archaemetzincin
MAIALWWLGTQSADEELLDRAGLQVQQEFGLPVVRWRSDGRPAGTFDARRGQHSSREMLRWLVHERPADAARVLGITDVDLFIPVLTFVFGEAQIGGVAAIVSTTRLAQGVNRATFGLRLSKECVHEVGHTFGLVHCESLRCVMSRSASVRSVDVKNVELCPVCRARYRMYQQDGLHVYREYENPRR